MIMETVSQSVRQTDSESVSQSTRASVANICTSTYSQYFLFPSKYLPTKSVSSSTTTATVAGGRCLPCICNAAECY
jgi:hypothetical protein